MTNIMNKSTILTVAGLLLLSAACTTVKPVYNNDNQSFAAQLKAGDRVRLTYLDGRSEEINLSEVDDTGLRGTLFKNTQTRPKGALIVVDWRDVYAVETVKVSAVKTAGAAVGVVVAIPFLALGALLMGAGGM